MRSLKPYTKVLRSMRVVWMDGDERGMAVRIATRRYKYPVQLWPYGEKTADDQALVVTHEAVHYARTPAFDADEASVDKVTEELLQDPVWRALIHRFLNGAFLESIKAMKKERVTTLGEIGAEIAGQRSLPHFRRR